MKSNERGMSRWMVAALLGVLLVAGVARANAQGAKPSPVTMTFRNLTLAHDSARARTRKNGDAVTNDTLRYELVFKNPATVALKNVVFENPLPSNLLMIAGTATTTAPATIEYSVDGGKTFSAEPRIKETVNGQSVERAATPAEYTHIRWTVTGSIAPGATVTARYDVRVGVRR